MSDLGAKGCDLQGQEYWVECLSAVDLSDNPIQSQLSHWSCPDALQLVYTSYQSCNVLPGFCLFCCLYRVLIRAFECGIHSQVIYFVSLGWVPAVQDFFFFPGKSWFQIAGRVANLRSYNQLLINFSLQNETFIFYLLLTLFLALSSFKISSNLLLF